MMRISMVPEEHVTKAWHHVEPMLRRCLERLPGRYLTVDIYKDILQHQAALWIAFEEETGDINGVVVTKVIEYPESKVLLLEWCAGITVDEWLDAGNDVMKAYAKDMGCSSMEAVGRKGWEPRLSKYGWKPLAVHYVCKLED